MVTARHDEARPADAIVVLGAAQYDGRPSPVLAGRLDHALELWQAGLRRTIVVTGGKQPVDRFTEAAASADYLEERGVPAAAILQETTGRTRGTRCAAAAGLLDRRAWSACCSCPTRPTRCGIEDMAEELGLTAFTSPTDVGLAASVAWPRRRPAWPWPASSAGTGWSSSPVSAASAVRATARPG